MPDHPRRIIGLPWYRREDYAAIRRIMSDSHALASTYEQWFAAAENNEAVGRQAGLEIMRVMIEPDVFRAWCLSQDLKPDSAARTKYASEHVENARA